MNFESGALAKELGGSRVVPIAIDLLPSEIKLPLGQFNGEPLTREGITRLMHSINSAAVTPLDRSALDTAVDVWWPRLEVELGKVPQSEVAAEQAEARGERDILLEVLDSVRGIVRTLASRQAPAGGEPPAGLAADP